MLNHRGYQGAVSFADGRLIIRILHIEDTVTDECDSASKAQAHFEGLVDDYLDTCKALGKEPSRPFKGSFNVRVSPSLHRRAAMAAADRGQSLNAWVEQAIENDLATCHEGDETTGTGIARRLSA
ncbi:type II toxin-antitoxin system HicB family antitoxin [Aurantimonas sp. 22II-16-19i]|uniref:type II toxin-antitoxin system HicB family antitoxin n=1 Tax=Aurantimonas sp. 22II-16-19i TaxID=1317114 RepID=UPI0009F7E60F|nr:type II toxin-antitoxin system HicB family antitoxin [Aurantimonas sp. 22II-16-19i]ORE87952.1 HicB family protein [Aurantimonas sp. 22II-16-19i]